LQKEDGSLRGITPDQLAAFSLAVLDVDVASRILQAAILEHAVDKHAVIEDDVLIFKCPIFVSSHTRTPGPLFGVYGNSALAAAPFAASRKRL
jgi:hypothetical protein